ncbi:MAG: hypothetical protein A7316_06065 [Candidatus Altiarchaeales archaeon WOR_SM1_86-2]|nr:MAG: hypothetical protein A7316_06065 [Candidatus Altiarchaeales archaeon WOR_SM1_86-2]
MDLIIKKGKVYYENRFIDSDIGVRDGKIVKIKKRVSNAADSFIDAKNQYVVPGIIDAHVHLRDMKQSHKEDFVTGSRAALNMPNSDPSALTVNVLRRMDALRKNAVVDIKFFAGLRDNLNEIPGMNDHAAVAGYKVYMTGDSGVSREELVNIFDFFSNKLFKIWLNSGQTHSGDSLPREKFNQKNKNKKIKRIAVHTGDDKPGEIEGIKFVSGLTGRFKIPVHICHISTSEGIEIVSKNPDLTSEVTPHHLFLSKGEYEFDAVNPSLRSKGERPGLWKMLDKVDIIASDHAPHTLKEKEDGAPGFPGLETSLPLMLNAVNKNMIPFERVIGMMSEKPAEIFGLTNKGMIKEGCDADLTVIDLKERWKIRGDDFCGKQKWTPFEGWEVKGVPTHTIVNGRIVMEDKELI